MTASRRSYALDVFRGLTIVGMIIVNNPGSWKHLYSPLAHAEWHGWTITDLIFPFFLIIVGIAIGLSYGEGSKSHLSQQQQHREMIVRALKLYGLGIFLGLFFYQFHNPDFSWIDDRLQEVRLAGVLQRIAIVYLLASLLFIHTPRFWHSLIFIGLLTLYWLLMMFVPYSLPDGGLTSGNLDPGNNLAAWLDHHIFGSAHLYHQDTQPFASDPEGLLTSLPALASCIGGFFIADILHRHQLPLVRAKALFKLGFICLPLAYLAELSIPFNKNLWTPSYVLLAQGWASLLLAGIIVVTDHWKIRTACHPLVVFGMNAIALFVLSGLVARLLLMIRVGDASLKIWLYKFFTGLPVAEKFQSLLFAFVFLAVMYLPMAWMFRRQIFWKV